MVWFTEINAHQIGRFDPVTETFSEEPTPTPDSMPYGLAIDADDNVWFTEMNAVKIAVRWSGRRVQLIATLPALSSGVGPTILASDNSSYRTPTSANLAR